MFISHTKESALYIDLIIYEDGVYSEEQHEFNISGNCLTRGITASD